MGDIRVSVDRGGTFCDVIATGADGDKPFIFKLLSEDPSNYPDEPTEAVRRVLEKYTGRKIPVGEKLDASRIELQAVKSFESSRDPMKESFGSSSKPCADKATYRSQYASCMPTSFQIMRGW
ncbi:hypothetical protein LB505_014298 [Fusarium chuoi]|nr:hypothetical protein LB505_014298 [Fusarium chuoi]